MSEAVSASRDLRKVVAGAQGAASRWSDPANRRIVRLDDLTIPERELVLALVEAAKADVAQGPAIDEREARLAAGARALAERQAKASGGGNG